MELLRKIYQETQNLHHAYLIEGDASAILPELFGFLRKDIGIVTEGNPDLLHMTFGVFGVDEGRRLKEMHTGKAFSGNGRYFIITVSSFTSEAQNSLLKVFEDPVPGVHFFVTIPAAENILPTLRSRFFIIEHKSKYAKDKNEIIPVQEFLASTKTARLGMIKDIIEEKEKERAIRFLNDLESVFHNTLIQISDKGGIVNKKNIMHSVEEIEQGKKYIGDRSSSLKLILEHLALVIPRINR